MLMSEFTNQETKKIKGQNATEVKIKKISGHNRFSCDMFPKVENLDYDLKCSLGKNKIVCYILSILIYIIY